MNWSPFDPEIIADPGKGHQKLLRECPVHHCEEFDPPFYTLSRYDDVAHALRDFDTYTANYGQGPRFAEMQGLYCDPPKHTQLRRVLQEAFKPRAMQALKPKIERLTSELLADAKAKGAEFDLHDDVAFPLPVLIIAEMLGVPESDLDQFKYWSDMFVDAMAAQDPSEYEKDQTEFSSYLLNHLQQRRRAIESGRDVPDDLLTVIANAEYPEEQLAPEADGLSMLTQLLVGGNETTTSLITNMVWRLLEVPDRWEEVRQNPELVPAAIEESLRYDPPILGLYRSTAQPVTLHGVDIPEQCKVWINYAAANRDENHFNDPDSFDLHRERQRHLSFGLGVHFCIGAPMVRLEAEVALRSLLEQMPNLRLVSSGERIPPFFLWGRRKLPLRWD